MSTSIVKAGEIATPTWTEQQRNLIRKTVCPPNTTDLEFEFFSAFCAQPVIRATRIRRGPSAGKTCGSSLRLTGGMWRGAIASIAFSRASGIRKAKGRPIFAPSSARRKRIGCGRICASTQRSMRSDSGRR
jgi:hypothetical protein